jgi:hypothetical protein
VWANEVKPAVVSIEKLAAHYAISSLFQAYPDRSRVYCYDAERQVERIFRTGRMRLVLGVGRFVSTITGESARLSYGVVHFGDHNVSAGVREFHGEATFEQLVGDAGEAFERADLAAVIRVMDRHFGEATYSLQTMFRDEQRRALAEILESTLSELASVYAQAYASHAPMMRFLADLGVPQPRGFLTTAEFVINHELRRVLRADEPAGDRVRELLHTAAREGVKVEMAELAYLLEQRLERIAGMLYATPLDLALVERARALATVARTLPTTVKLWRVQNIVFELLHGVWMEQSARTDEATRRWSVAFAELAGLLGLRVAPPAR